MTRVLNVFVMEYSVLTHEHQNNWRWVVAALMVVGVLLFSVGLLLVLTNISEKKHHEAAHLGIYIFL